MKDPYYIELESFRRYIHGERIPIQHMVFLALKAIIGIFDMSIRYIPGAFGFKIRYYYYKLFLKKLGKGVLIETGVFFIGPRNICIGDYVLINKNCTIDAMQGKISIGKRIHIAPFTQIVSNEPIIIGDYVGISSFVRIYSSSVRPFQGKRMSGSMVPEEMADSYSKPVTICKDSFIGSGSILLPGADLGEGVVVGANSVVKDPVNPYQIVAGVPAKIIGKREKVNVPDI